MTYRLLLDENVERAVAERLAHDGHDVERVATAPGLGAGTDDERVATYAREQERVIVTYDDDFVHEAPETPTLYVPDETVTAETVARIVSRIARHYPRTEISGVVFAGTNWL